jgi:hypothetical protein
MGYRYIFHLWSISRSDFPGDTNIFLPKPASASRLLREREVFAHLNSINSMHAGVRCVRTLLATFEIETKSGSHICLVHKPSGLPQ